MPRSHDEVFVKQRFLMKIKSLSAAQQALLPLDWNCDHDGDCASEAPTPAEHGPTCSRSPPPSRTRSPTSTSHLHVTP